MITILTLDTGEVISSAHDGRNIHAEAWGVVVSTPAGSSSAAQTLFPWHRVAELYTQERGI